MKLLKYQPHEKIRYSAGLISLVLFPILCLGWLYKHKAFEKQGVINISFYDPERNKKMPKELQYEFPPKRDYTTIDLKGNDHNDMVSLQYAHVLLNNWKIAKDTLQGLRFHYGEKAKYWTFVESINVLKAADLEWYMPYKNDMYAIYTSRYFKPRPFYMYDCLLCGDVRSSPLTSEQVSEKLWNERATFFKYAFKNYWAPFLIFATMLVITMLNLRKRNLLHKSWIF
jgi:hypothetical protein